jgi:hypothetical protein
LALFSLYAARGHRQDRQGAKIAKAFLKMAIIMAYNLLIVGDLGPLAILAVFPYCACRNKAILIAFTWKSDFSFTEFFVSSVLELGDLFIRFRKANKP